MSMNGTDPGFQMRLVRLEENVFFQEKKMQELDEEMRAMQKQLQTLQAQIGQMRDSYMQIRDFLSSRFSETPDPLPPHYQQDK